MNNPRSHTAHQIRKDEKPTVWAPLSTPLGTMSLAATPAGLRGAWFEGQQHHPDLSAWDCKPDNRVLQAARRQLDAYFSSGLRVFDLPLDLSAGTAWQQGVWHALLLIQCGTTARYAQLAANIGKPGSARAVGHAVGRNPLSIIVPCHRVLGAGGALTGYAGGVARKQALLELEGALARAEGLLA